MTLTELWTAMARGDGSVLASAYLHRVMRERGADLIKGRDDVAADWHSVIGQGGDCIVLADLGDLAVVRIGDVTWHHWVSREDGRISFEVLIAADQITKAPDAERVIEHSITAGGRTAELFHWFGRDSTGQPMRRTGSRILGELAPAVGEPLRNG